MALIKEIELENGVITNYHRIVSVNNITNQASIIELASYTSKGKRLEEKNSIRNHQPINIFVKSRYINRPYNQMLEVDSAYAYLKTLDEFRGYEND